MVASIKRLAARRSARSELEFKREMVHAREARELSQRALADLMGVDHSTISRLERLDSDLKLSLVREYLAYCEAAMDLTVVKRDVLAKEQRELTEKHNSRVTKFMVQYVDEGEGESPNTGWSAVPQYRTPSKR